MTNLLCVTIPEEQDTLYETLYALAMPDRKQRADCFRRREDGLRCLVAGELLRRTVQRELGLANFAVITDEAGKPRIADQNGFHFNLSHSGNRVAIAWGDSPVGVDVQQMRADVNREALAKRFFTAEEQQFIFEEPEGINERFYRIWTGKESYLKYLGTGLTKPIGSFSVLSPEITPMVKTEYLPDGYCLSLCCGDPNCLIRMDFTSFTLEIP